MSSALRDIASAGGGKSFLVNQGNAAISAIADMVKRSGGKMVKSHRYVSAEARFQFFVLPALLLLLFHIWIYGYKKGI